MPWAAIRANGIMPDSKSNPGKQKDATLAFFCPSKESGHGTWLMEIPGNQTPCMELTVVPQNLLVSVDSKSE